MQQSDVGPFQIVGATPGAFRRVGVVPGAVFEGERLSGVVLEGASDCGELLLSNQSLIRDRRGNVRLDQPHRRGRHRSSVGRRTDL